MLGLRTRLGPHLWLMLNRAIAMTGMFDRCTRIGCIGMALNRRMAVRTWHRCLLVCPGVALRLALKLALSTGQVMDLRRGSRSLLAVTLLSLRERMIACGMLSSCRALWMLLRSFGHGRVSGIDGCHLFELGLRHKL